MKFHPKIWPHLPRILACPQGWDFFGFRRFPRLPRFPRIPQNFQVFQELPEFPNHFTEFPQYSVGFARIPAEFARFPRDSFRLRGFPRIPMKTFPNCMIIHVKILPKPFQNLPKTSQDPAQSLPGRILGEGPEFPSKCIDFHVHLGPPGLPNPSKTLPKSSPNPSRTLPKPSLGGVMGGGPFYQPFI